jgi:hypothetical protein
MRLDLTQLSRFHQRPAKTAMSAPEKKRLIDKIRATCGKVRSFRVTVNEFCLDDHPMSSAQWSYSGEDMEGRDIFTSLKHDRTTMKTASFDLLRPVYSAAMQGIPKKNGKLPAYHTDNGESVTRSYECEIIYDTESEPHEVM